MQEEQKARKVHKSGKTKPKVSFKTDEDNKEVIQAKYQQKPEKFQASV